MTTHVARIMHTLNVFKSLLFVVLIFTLSGCIERKIYTEITDQSILSHPPQTLRIEDPSGMLKTNLPNDPNATVKMSVYIHCTKCTNAQSKSLGTDFDGYIRLTISDGNCTLARAQMDYKGEATPNEVAQVFEHLMETLQWTDTFTKN
jgi:hypothetical protein